MINALDSETGAELRCINKRENELKRQPLDEQTLSQCAVPVQQITVECGCFKSSPIIRGIIFQQQYHYQNAHS